MDTRKVRTSVLSVGLVVIAVSFGLWLLSDPNLEESSESTTVVESSRSEGVVNTTNSREEKPRESSIGADAFADQGPLEDKFFYSTEEAANYVLENLPNEEPTHVAQQSGDWFDQDVWGGELPNEGARVLIPEDLSIRLDGEVLEHMQSVYVAGNLRFAEQGSTFLKVHNMLVGDQGSLTVGTVDEPIGSSASALLEITPRQDVMPYLEPGYHDAMLVIDGDFSMVGHQKTNMYPLKAPLAVSSNFIDLPQAPEGWQEGDLVVVGGARNVDEKVLAIKSIEGPRVFFESANSEEEWKGFTKYDTAERNRRNFAINIQSNTGLTTESKELLNEGQVYIIQDGDSDIVFKDASILGLGIDSQRRQITASYGAADAPALTITGKQPEDITLDGLVVVNAPDEAVIVQGGSPRITNSVNFNDYTGGAYYNELGSTSQLVWEPVRKPTGAASLILSQ